MQIERLIVLPDRRPPNPQLTADVRLLLFAYQKRGHHFTLTPDGTRVRVTGAKKLTARDRGVLAQCFHALRDLLRTETTTPA